MTTTDKNTRNSHGEPIDQLLDTNQVAATLPTTNWGTFHDSLGTLPGVESVEFLDGGAEGVDALAPRSLFDQLRRTLSEERRPIERLEDAIADGGSIAVIAHDGEQSTVNAITHALEQAGAGWAFNFSELSWSELRSPRSPGSS